MLDTIKVERDNPDAGKPIRDPETGTVTYPDPTITVYGPGIAPHHGKARVRIAYAAAQVYEQGGGIATVQQFPLSVPIDVRLQQGDRVTVVASDNPAQVGAVRYVRALHHGSQQTANRYGLEEL